MNRFFEIDLAEVNLPGCNMVLSIISEPDGRGIIVYIKESIDYTEVMFNTDFRESVWTMFKCNGKEFLFGCSYRSPSSTVSNNSELLCLLPTIANTYDKFCIVGDFNLLDINWNLFSCEFISNTHFSFNFLECLQDCYINQLVDSPTRIRIGQRPNILIWHWQILITI